MIQETLAKDSDERPARHGWAPGHYLNRCGECECRFIGAKLSKMCADCAYAKPDVLPQIIQTGGLIDRMARHMFATDEQSRKAASGIAPMDWADIGDVYRQTWRDRARSALEAAEDATDEMCIAGNAATTPWIGDLKGHALVREKYRRRWRSMVRAALNT